jgi:LPXTG-motif cell wall-anchored protein
MLGSYAPAFTLAGVLCLVATASFLLVRKRTASPA